MPRPGPRPYECVRRAWHSERHQPLRGLIIQHIFRLVQDNHCVTTKKNKEWQEKLPILVMKAEEIMYSKANSEAEYSNPDTVWERVNDAVDTIIRKDETTETAGLLPPCVEAALNLGCVPVRASRSQLQNNQRTYLRPSYKNSPKFPNPKDKSQQNSPPMHLHSSNIDSPPLFWDFNKGIAPNITDKPVPFIGDINSIEVDHNRGSVYPLYYGTNFRPSQKLGFREPQKSNSIIVGVPVYVSVADTTEVGYLHNLFPYDGKDENITKVASKRKEPEMGCDLSLRLGLFSDSNSNSVYRDEGHQCHPKEKEFSFFPVEPASSRLHKTSGWNSEGENHNTGLASRKRNLPFDANIEYDRFL